MTVFNKLVRDFMPDILASQGIDAVTVKETDNDRVLSLLYDKMNEEWTEYLNKPCIEEIADLAEVILSIAERLGYTQTEVIEAVDKKATSNGRFRQGLILIETRGVESNE